MCQTAVCRLVRLTSGQDLIEYALLGAFVALLAYAGATGLGGSLNGWFGAMSEVVEEGQKKSNCSGQGMISSGGKCHGG